MRTFDPTTLSFYDLIIMKNEAVKNGERYFFINENQMMSVDGFENETETEIENRYMIPNTMKQKTVFTILQILKNNNINSVEIQL